jgi:uncharacterized membrane protein
MSNLIAIAYDNLETAQTVRDKLFDLQRERLITMEDVAVVERMGDGRIKLHQARSAAGAGAIGGALWGGLIGLIFFVPFLGAAFGAAAGAAAGAMSDTGVDDEFMRQVGEDLQPGKAALFVLVMHSTPEKVLPEVAPYGGHVMRTSLSKEADAQLREAIETAHKIPAARAGQEKAARAEHKR